MPDRFIIGIHLRAPLVLGGRLTLDGLAAGVGYEKTLDPAAAMADVPIARTSDGIPMASQMLLEVPAIPRLNAITMVQQSFGRILATDPQMAGAVSDLPAVLDVGRGDYQNVMNKYQTVDVPTVWFIGCGELAAMEKLLRHLSNIGPQRNKGFGEVAEIEFHTVPSDNPLFGIVGDDRLLRPVPTRYRHVLPNRITAPVVLETWQNPYLPKHGGEVTPCLVPDFMTGEGSTRQELEAFWA